MVDKGVLPIGLIDCDRDLIIGGVSLGTLVNMGGEERGVLLIANASFAVLLSIVDYSSYNNKTNCIIK